MADPRRPGEEEEIERFLRERGATMLPPGGRGEPMELPGAHLSHNPVELDGMLAARAAGNVTRGKARSRAGNNLYWKRVQAERKKRADG